MYGCVSKVLMESGLEWKVVSEDTGLSTMRTELKQVEVFCYAYFWVMFDRSAVKEEQHCGLLKDKYVKWNLSTSTMNSKINPEIRVLWS